MPILDKPAAFRPAIPNDPLPQPADSLYDEQELVKDRALLWFMPLVLLAFWTLTEWCQYFFPTRVPLAVVVTLTALTGGFILFFSVKIRRLLRLADQLKLGIRGELHIAQYLEKTCRPLGYQIFHDIPCTGSGGEFNIDHALIGPAGIFAIETKNWSLPPKGTDARIRFNPQIGTLTKPDGTFDNAAVHRAQANADFLRKLLAERTARPANALPSRPVLILPGWFVADPTPSPRPVWIVGNNTLHQWLANEPRQLSNADIASLAAALTDYLRNQPG